MYHIVRKPIQNPAKHLKLLAVHYFCKTLHRKCLAGFWIRIFYGDFFWLDKYEIAHFLIRLKGRWQNSKCIKFTIIIRSLHSNIYYSFCDAAIKVPLTFWLTLITLLRLMIVKQVLKRDPKLTTIAFGRHPIVLDDVLPFPNGCLQYNVTCL